MKSSLSSYTKLKLAVQKSQINKFKLKNRISKRNISNGN